MEEAEDSPPQPWRWVPRCREASSVFQAKFKGGAQLMMVGLQNSNLLSLKDPVID
jgi:hypothetical protein